MKPYVFTKQAGLDLEELWAFIAEDDVDAADRVVADIHEAARKLSKMPEMGHHRTDLADEALRFWLVHSYLVVYRPDTKPLQIIRVLSHWRDVDELFK